MKPNTLQTRGVGFAFLFGPPRFVNRDEAMQIHGNICDALKLDDISFQYTPSGTDSNLPSKSKGFEITLQRKEGRGGFVVKIANSNIKEPMSFVMSYDWPPSLQDVYEFFDDTAKGVFQGFDKNNQRVKAEVRLRAQCNVEESNALGFIQRRILKLATQSVDDLGRPLVFGSVRLEIASSAHTESSLENPRREIKIEPLREDPKILYLELVSHWTQFPEGVQGGVEIDLSRVRPIDHDPREYIEEAYSFLDQRLLRIADAPKE